MECVPAFNYGRDHHETTLVGQGACFHSPTLELALGTHQRLQRERTGVVSEFALTEDETATFVLGETTGRHCEVLLTHDDAEDLVAKTEEYWRSWLSQCTYRGRWREMVRRSALTLKLLTFEPTGCDCGGADVQPAGSTSGESGTGTIATPGSETRPSRPTASCGLGSLSPLGSS